MDKERRGRMGQGRRNAGGKVIGVSAAEGARRASAVADTPAAEAGGPLVAKLTRSPGEREARWAQLLGGPVMTAPAAASLPIDASTDAIGAGEIAALKANQRRLQAEVLLLRAQLQRLAAELGVDLS